MSTPREPAPPFVFLSVLSAEWDALWDGLFRTITDRLGTPVHGSGPMPFTHTGYYDREMGTPLVRRIFAFDPGLDMDCLPELKLWTNGLESELAREDGTRRVNLDPGLLTLERLVLATGKNFTHRIYLGKGIWGDLTLVRRGPEWTVLPWTFPDYRDKAMLAELERMRALYHDRPGNDRASKHKDPE